MKILGIDFTSRPSRRKPLTCLTCALDGDHLQANSLETWTSLADFESVLRRPGPWIAGIDFPFGQSRRLVEALGWPGTWDAYVAHVQTLGREGFRAALDAYRCTRPPGDKEHRRATDAAVGALSPQKLYGTPVGLMFFEGAPRLREADVTVPGLRTGDPRRIVVEAYPGALARRLIGRRSYKHDDPARQSSERARARGDLLACIQNGGVREAYGIRVTAPADLAEDPTGDRLDALLCAIQAARAWRKRDQGFGLPSCVDPLEGAIAEPV
jgi:hypothetical protein